MKEKIKTNKLFIPIVLLSIFIILSFMNTGYSKTDSKLALCTISEEYLAWEQLSEEEKANTITPTMCDKSADTINNRFASLYLKGTLPASYDGRNQSYQATVKNQSSTNGCWAFATTTSLETYVQKKLTLTQTYSTRHIEYSSTREFLNGEINDHGYDREVGSGGNYYMSSNYLINNYGPILESDMPFELNEDVINISEIENKEIQLDINDIILSSMTSEGICTASEIQTIKEYVYEYGAVAISTYLTFSSDYYNSTTAAFYYNGIEYPNHAVTIIGWDDNYSKSNFSANNQPSSNGAWIVQNSYGTSFGDKGYYYISYEDFNNCYLYMTIKSADTEIEDNSYIYDKLGYNAALGYVDYDYNGLTTAYAMNVFTKGNTLEVLKEITFGSSASGSYQIYYMEGDASNSSISDMTLIGSGTMSNSGYVTHELNQTIFLNKDVTTFSIAIYYNMNSYTRPVPITLKDSTYQSITVEANQSYASGNGVDWEDLADFYGGAIASIKAFTNDADFIFKIDSYNVIYQDNISLQMNTTTSNIDTDLLTIEIFDSNNQKISKLDTVYTSKDDVLNQITLYLDSTISNGTYIVSIYYQDNLIATTSVVIVQTQNITSSTYSIDSTNLIIYTTPNTSITTFINNIQNSSNIIFKEDEIVTDGNIGTGMIVDNYTIVVKGDVTGDGLVNIADVIKIADHTISGKVLTKEAYQKAAEVTNDSNINIADVIKIADYTLNKNITL